MEKPNWPMAVMKVSPNFQKKGEPQTFGSVRCVCLLPMAPNASSKKLCSDLAQHSPPPTLIHTQAFSEGKEASCVALGRNFGVTFRIVGPRPRAAPPPHPEGAKRKLSAGGGDESGSQTERPTQGNARHRASSFLLSPLPPLEIPKELSSR